MATIPCVTSLSRMDNMMTKSQQKRIAEILTRLVPDAELLVKSTVADELPNLESFIKLVSDPKTLLKQLRFLSYHIELAGQTLAGRRVLDVGSGLGIATIVFTQLAGCKATGIEKSAHLYEIASALAAKLPDEQRPHLVCGDVTALPFPDSSFPVVTC